MLLRHAARALGQELFEKSVVTHVASIYADLLKQKKAFTKRKKFNSHMHRIALEYQHGHRFMFLNTNWDL